MYRYTAKNINTKVDNSSVNSLVTTHTQRSGERFYWAGFAVQIYGFHWEFLVRSGKNVSQCRFSIFIWKWFYCADFPFLLERVFIGNLGGRYMPPYCTDIVGSCLFRLPESTKRFLTD